MNLGTSTAQKDKAIFSLISQEAARQESQVMLIASENYVSPEVLQAQGSVLTNKYAEGYSGARYYEGCEIVDAIEDLAIERCKQIFGARYVNVQPHSGSQANQAVIMALLKPGDRILSMSLNSGGHLTHGSPVNLSGKWFEIRHYSVNDRWVISYEEIEKIAQEFKPKLIICGYSAYSQLIDFKKFREIADQVGAFLLADIAHIAGIIAANYVSGNGLICANEAHDATSLHAHMMPLEYAHVVTSTTHKTLRGPRGGIIMTNDEGIAKKINSAVFPGIQGGPLMHVIAAKAVAFQEAHTQAYVNYIQQVLNNAKFLAQELQSYGFNVLAGGTENHMILIDLSNKGITGADMSLALSKIGIICNKNSVPNDRHGPKITSGIRIGTPATTTRNFGYPEYSQIASAINTAAEVVVGRLESSRLEKCRMELIDICHKFPIYR